MQVLLNAFADCGCWAGLWRERLVSALEVERGGTRVTEGDLGNWAEVSLAISNRVRELGWRRRELAERFGIGVESVGETSAVVLLADRNRLLGL